MKKILIIASVIALVSLFFFAQTFTAAVLPVGKPPEITIPANNSPQQLSIVALSAGKMLSKAGLAFRGGDLSEVRVFTMGGVLIKHPQGNLLIDAGFAADIDAHFKTTTKMMQWTSEYEAGSTVAEQLQEAGVEPGGLDAIILTHAHWDHVSGIADLPNTPVWVTEAEMGFINSDSEHTKLARLIGTEEYKTYGFPGGEYLGFKRSYDVFGDGSTVIVPATGHSPGAVVVFVTLADQQRFAFIGDLAWQSEGITLPAEKPWLPRKLIGEDEDAARKLLVHMHHLNNIVPNLSIVPSHDQAIWDSLPSLD